MNSWATCLRYAFKFLMLQIIWMPCRAFAEVELGVRDGIANISTKGYVAKSISVSNAIGLDLSAPVRRSLTAHVFFESAGQEYQFAAGGLRIFPLSQPSKEETVDGYTRVIYADHFRPFIGASFGFGKLRLRTKPSRQMKLVLHFTLLSSLQGSFGG